MHANLVPTAYEQPEPINGKYPATVYQDYAEFEYEGFKVLAKVGRDTLINANGNEGLVTVYEGFAKISVDHNTRKTGEPEEKNDLGSKSISYEKQLIATLNPLRFNQEHPFLYGDFDRGFMGIFTGTRANFGVISSYEATVDGNIRGCGLRVPCRILPISGDPMKCIIEFDDFIIFMAKRYGADFYDELVKKTVNEFQQFLPKE